MMMTVSYYWLVEAVQQGIVALIFRLPYRASDTYIGRQLAALAYLGVKKTAFRQFFDQSQLSAPPV